MCYNEQLDYAKFRNFYTAKYVYIHVFLIDKLWYYGRYISIQSAKTMQRELYFKNTYFATV